MDVLLLAAGRGVRLEERTRQRPKALVELHGKPLLDYMLDHAVALPWMERVVVVTGFGRDQVRARIDAYAPSKPLVEVFNPAYHKGNFYSLLAGLAHVGEEWVNTNVDHVFPRRLLDHCHTRRAGISAVCDRDRELGADCMKVQVARGDRDERVAAIDKQLAKWDAGYIGLTFVTREGRVPYLDAVERVKARGEEGAAAEHVLAELAREGGSKAPHVLDASGFGWLEIDDEHDFHRAEAALQQRPDFLA